VVTNALTDKMPAAGGEWPEADLSAAHNRSAISRMAAKSPPIAWLVVDEDEMPPLSTSPI
jgi:hypothetical protein